MGKRSEVDLTLNRIDARHRNIFIYIAHIPPPASIDNLVLLMGISAIDILNAAESLKAKGLIYETKGRGKGFYFPVDAYVSALSEDPVLSEEARLIISAITDWYRNSHTEMTDEETLALASLYMKIGDTNKGLTTLTRAADILARAGQDEKAVEYYDYILQAFSDGLIPPGKVDAYLDSALRRVSLLIYHLSTSEELSLLKKARSLAKRFRKWNHLAKAEITMAQILQTSGENEEALKCFGRFMKLVSKIEDPRMIRSAIHATCEFLFWRGRFAEVISHYEKIVGSLEDFGDDETSLKAAALVGHCFVVCGRVARGTGMIDAVRAKSEMLGFNQVSIFTDQMTILSMLEIGRIAEVEPYLDRSLNISEKSLGYMVSRGVYDQKAYVLSVKGDFQAAFDFYRRGIEQASRLGCMHHPGFWVFEYLDLMESNGFVDDEANYDSEVSRLIQWDNLGMKGAAFRYRALRNMERGQALSSVLPDLRMSERCLKQAGAEVELARTRIALGRYFLKKDQKKARSFLEMAWAVLSGIDKNLFPKDLLGTLSEERPLEVMVERMIHVNESLGTIRDKVSFLEKVIEVAMDFAMATRGTFITLENGELKQVVSRNIDPLFFETDQYRKVSALVSDTILKGIEIVFPNQIEGNGISTDYNRVYEKTFHQAGIQSFIGLPAQLADQMYGYLCLDNRLGGRPFSDSQLHLVRFLCSQISIGLSNLDTYNQMKQLKERFEDEAIFYKKGMGIATPNEIVGTKSEAMKKVVERIRQAAPTDTTVLILGETGVGKELVAKTLHNLSARSNGPFISVNLAAIPPDLVASELFGHEKGAFTGAHERQKGRFELAHEGTMFLDEIGDLPAAIQVKLLRVLQEGTFERLGNAQPIHSDFRVIAATNKDLWAEVEKGNFRRDLYYRLDVVPIHVPPLRGRKEDIPDLMRHFVEKFCRKLGRKVVRVPREETKKLLEHTWPGNVRELEHRIEQAITLSDGAGIFFTEMVQPHRGDVTSNIYRGELVTMEELERDYIEKVLARTRWRVRGRGGAASILGLKPTTLFYRMNKLGLKRS